MPDFPIRKIITQVEEITHEGGAPAVTPRLRGAVIAVVKNPFAGSFHETLQPAMEDLKPLGREMTERLIAALGGIDGIDGYGKGAIVGENGETEHGALWHVPGGYAMRERLGEARAIVPSAMKVGGVGTALDVPLGHIERRWHRHVVVAGKIDRTHWEMATYGALANALASGDIWVPRSRLHRLLDVLLAPSSGAALQPAFSLGDPDAWLDQRAAQRVLAGAPGQLAASQV